MTTPGSCSICFTTYDTRKECLCRRSLCRSSLKFSAGAPIYYGLLGKKLFGNGIKYPLLRFAGVPDRLLRNHLYLDFTGYKRNPKGMDEFPGEIVPAFQTVRDQSLNMIDASI